MSRNLNTKLQSSISNERSLYLLLFIVFAFLISAPFQMMYFNGAGLHSIAQFQFELKSMYGFCIGIVAFLVVSIRLFKTTVIEQRHLVVLVGLLIPLSYYLSSLTAVSKYLATISNLLNFAVYGFLLLGVALSNSRKLLNIMMYGYMLIGSLIALDGFMYIVGNKFRLDALMYNDGVRLGGLFTYPNSYAVFLITMLLAIFHYLTVEKNLILKIGLGLILVPIALSFILTLSRGAIITLPVIALITLLISSLKKQLLLGIYFVPSFLLSLIVQSYFSEIGNEVYVKTDESVKSGQEVETVPLFSVQSMKAWGVLVIVSVIMAILIYLFHKYLAEWLNTKIEKWKIKRLSNLWIPGSIIVIIVIAIMLWNTEFLTQLLPSALSDRLNEITFQTHSVLERLTMYQDALKIWRDYPITGGGGGVWEALYERYQSYPYISSQVHSFPIRVLIETGLVGFVIVIGFILFVLTSYLIRCLKNKDRDENYSIYFLISSAIFVHSLIDFGMNYFYLIAIVFLCLGILVGQQTNKITIKIIRGKTKLITRSIGTIFCIIGVVLLFNIYNFMYADTKFNESERLLSSRPNLNELTTVLADGLKHMPNHPFLLDRMATIYKSAYQQMSNDSFKTEALRYVARLDESEPNFSALSIVKYYNAKEWGSTEETIEILEKAIENQPFQLSYYELIFQERYLLWTQFNEQKDLINRNLQKDRILSLYTQVLERASQLQQLNQAISINRNFEITSNMNDIINHIKGAGN
ncbi:MAG: O-antigen ligase family protein [Candidatus Cohnella colombiensis]|uniref:O-antigen ligase family protein n=1 Tax=Candidatus Cohnella colombiensis TaxID=3121368 RepID=A0AA95JBC9_9BACL|nr:MAG: O-antigen ligase family protein [Cohnella sp.]